MTNVDLFQAHRPLLFGVAYRMLGSATDAEDVVQDAWLRYSSAPAPDVRSPKAYLTTILVRLCRDQLQLARRKREQYIGPWLPEPILTEEVVETADPQERVEKEESISLAARSKSCDSWLAAPLAARKRLVRHSLHERL